MIGSLYQPGRTPLHRAPAGRKLLGLLAAGVAIFLPWPWPVIAVGVLLGLAVVLSTGVGPRALLRALRGPLVVLALLFLVNSLFQGADEAAPAVLRLVILLFAAHAVTVTTRTADMIEVIERVLAPLDRRGWIDAGRVALAIALAIRLIPLLADQIREVREAQAARGLGFSPSAFLVPLLVRALGTADELAAAIDARSYPPASKEDSA